jgi:hypothetical protein
MGNPDLKDQMDRRVAWATKETAGLQVAVAPTDNREARGQWVTRDAWV